jgi:murein L,D-transpeptidase YafK
MAGHFPNFRALAVLGAFAWAFAGGAFLTAASPAPAQAQSARGALAIPVSAAGRDAIGRSAGRLGFALEDAGLRLGARVHLRVIKDQGRLEAFVRRRDGAYRLFRAYKLCGPRPAGEGPRKSARGGMPEGFYAIGRDDLRPQGPLYLGLSIGWPNRYDLSRRWIGGQALIQGSCAGGGHLSLTDPDAAELYTLVHAALRAGQPQVSVHAFPFAMTSFAMLQRRSSPHIGFWRTLRPAWTAFERTKTPPQVRFLQRRFVIVETRPTPDPR